MLAKRGMVPHPRRVRHRNTAELGYPSADARLFFRRSDLRGSVAAGGSWRSGRFRYRRLHRRRAAVVIPNATHGISPAMPVVDEPGGPCRWHWHPRRRQSPCPEQSRDIAGVPAAGRITQTSTTLRGRALQEGMQSCRRLLGATRRRSSPILRPLTERQLQTAERC